MSTGKIAPSNPAGIPPDGAPEWQSLTCSLAGPLVRELWKHCQATGQAISTVVASALAGHLQLDHSAIYQVSTAGAVVHGLYKGDTTIASLREHGDFGLGTFDGLDGEMVAFDGVFYASHQNEFPLKKTRGILVGFWSPGYLSSVLVAGYHLHFLSEDKRSGGHLLDCSAEKLQVQICPEADFRLTLPETRSFLGADLSGDPTADLHNAESSIHGDSPFTQAIKG